MGKCDCQHVKKINSNLLVRGDVRICGHLMVKDANTSLNLNNTSGQVTINQEFLEQNAVQQPFNQYTWVIGPIPNAAIPIDLTTDQFKPSLGYIYNETTANITIKSPVPVTSTPTGGPFVQGSAIFSIPPGQVATVNIILFEENSSGSIYETKFHLNPITQPLVINRP